MVLTKLSKAPAISSAQSVHADVMSVIVVDGHDQPSGVRRREWDMWCSLSVNLIEVISIRFPVRPEQR